MSVPTSKYLHILLRPAVAFLYLILLGFKLLAQDICKNPVEEVNGFVPPQEYSPEVTIRIDGLSRFPNRDSAAVLCVNINNPGLYRIKATVEYSFGTEQNNESFFMHVTNSSTDKVIDPCNPNLGPHRVIVPDPTQADTTILERDAGVFPFTRGANIISFVHYYRIHDRKPEYGQFVNGRFDTTKTESVKLLKLVLEPLSDCPTKTSNNYDLRLTKSVSQAVVSSGQEFSYSMEIANLGPNRALSINLTDVLPDSIFPKDFKRNPPIDANARPLEWQFANLDSGEVVNIEFSAIFPDSFDIGADSLRRINTSFIQADFDTNTQNDTALAIVTIKKEIPVYDLELTKNVNPGTVIPGEIFTYSLRIRNNGPDIANNIRLTDMLPDSIQPVHFLTDSPIDPTSRMLEWSVAPLDSGAIKDIEFTATFLDSLGSTESSRNLLNTGFVGAPFDVNAQNDTANALIRVLPRLPNYDLALSKSVSSDTVVQGQTFSYRLEITNNGPEAAPGFSVWDAFPIGVSLADFNLQPIDPFAQDTLRWRIEQSLLPGERIAITYTGQCPVLPNFAEPLIKINAARVIGENDSDPTNDSATASVVCLAPTDACEELVNLDRSLFRPDNETALAISVELDVVTDVTLDIFDITGYPIRRISTANASIGANTFFWDGQTNEGLKAGSGVYFVIVRDKPSKGVSLECLKKVMIIR